MPVKLQSQGIMCYKKEEEEHIWWNNKGKEYQVTTTTITESDITTSRYRNHLNTNSQEAHHQTHALGILVWQPIWLVQDDAEIEQRQQDKINRSITEIKWKSHMQRLWKQYKKWRKNMWKSQGKKMTPLSCSGGGIEFIVKLSMRWVTLNAISCIFMTFELN